MVLVNDIGVFSTYVSKNADYKILLKRNVTRSLLQKLIVIGPLVGTILHYAEGNFCNQKVFCLGCIGARGFNFRLKIKERKGNELYKESYISCNKRLCVIYNKYSLSHPKNYNPIKWRPNLYFCWPNPIFLPSSFLQIIQRVILSTIYSPLFFFSFLLFSLFFFFQHIYFL